MSEITNIFLEIVKLHTWGEIYTAIVKFLLIKNCTITAIESFSGQLEMMKDYNYDGEAIRVKIKMGYRISI